MSKIIAQSKMKEKNNECGKELLCSKCRKRVLYHIFRRPAKTVIKDIETTLKDTGNISSFKYELKGRLMNFIIEVKDLYQNCWGLGNLQ